MKLIFRVMDLVYATFGITPPRPGEEQRSLLITVLIILGCIVLVGGTLLLVYLLRFA
jgi:hypothetical protein